MGSGGIDGVFIVDGMIEGIYYLVYYGIFNGNLGNLISGFNGIVFLDIKIIFY